MNLSASDRPKVRFHAFFVLKQNSPTAGYLQEHSLHERIRLASVPNCVKEEGVMKVKSWGGPFLSRILIGLDRIILILHSFWLDYPREPYAL